MNTVYCSSCRRDVVPVRASIWWKVGLVAGIGGVTALVAGICILGMGLLIFAPVVAVLGLAILGNLVEGATRIPHCPNPACGKYLTGAVPARSASVSHREEVASRPAQSAA